MPLNRKPESLTLADLPDVDPARFDEWKLLQRRARKAFLLSPLIYASAFITVPVIGGGLGWALPIAFWFAYMFAYVAPIARAERTLAAELGVPAALGLPARTPATGGSTRAQRVIKIVLVLWLIGFVVGLIALAVQLSSAKRASAPGNERTASAGAPAPSAGEPYVVHLKDVSGEFAGARVPPRFFDEALAKPRAGRFFLPAEHESTAAPVVVISHNAWQNLYGGDLAVLGRAIQINGREATIVGIAPPAFRAPGWTDFWTPSGGTR